MKIAFVTTYDFSVPGGVRNHILGLSQAMRLQGHEVDILAPSSAKTDTDIPQFLPIAAFPTAKKRSLIPPHWKISYRVIRQLEMLLHQKTYDIVHIHEPLIPPVCLAALIKTKHPMCATFHTYYEHGQPLYRLFQPLLNHWLQRLRGRITVSAASKTYIERYFPYPYHVIPNGVDLQKYTTPYPVPHLIQDDKINLLFVGHAQFKRKGFSFLLKAYRDLKRQYPQLRLIIAGSQWTGRSRRALPQDLPDIIDFGMVNEETLIALYQSAHLFCAPSTGNESFGMVLLEAMAAGVPIVSTQIHGYMQVVQHQHHALLVPPKDSQRLAEAIEMLLNDEALRKRLIRQARLHVQSYDWKHIAHQTLDYYRQMIT